MRKTSTVSTKKHKYGHNRHMVILLLGLNYFIFPELSRSEWEPLIVIERKIYHSEWSEDAQRQSIDFMGEALQPYRGMDYEET